MTRRDLKHIVLVRGAAHGAWCWEEVVPLLAARGFDVAAIDLPGLGADRTPARDVTLESLYSDPQALAALIIGEAQPS